MATQGPTICGVGTDDGGRNDVWNNPQFITANDGQSATVTMGAAEVSNHLQANSFGFNIPGNATIIDNTVGIKYKATGGNASDSDVQLFSSPGNNIGTDQSKLSNWPSTATLTNYSGMWGLTSAQMLAFINSSDFGVSWVAQQVSGTPTAAVDYIQMTITYTVPAPASEPRVHCQSGRSGRGPHRNYQGPVG